MSSVDTSSDGFVVSSVDGSSDGFVVSSVDTSSDGFVVSSVDGSSDGFVVSSVDTSSVEDSSSESSKLKKVTVYSNVTGVPSEVVNPVMDTSKISPF